jgi:hypothetical protein
MLVRLVQGVCDGARQIVGDVDQLYRLIGAPWSR